MSLAAYARRRGVSKMAVTLAHQNDRLKASIVRDPIDGRVLGISDPFLADKEWDANSDMTKAPPATQDRAAELTRANAAALELAGFEPPRLEPGDEATVNGAKVRLTVAQAELAELKLAQAAGKLVPAADVKKEWVSMIASIRSKVLAIPSRCKQSLPHLTVADLAVLEGLVREVMHRVAVDD